MAYYYVEENNGESTTKLFPNVTTISISSIETTTNPLLFSNQSIESNDGNLQVRVLDNLVDNRPYILKISISQRVLVFCHIN